MNKKWMTMAVFALVLMMMVTAQVAAQQSVLMNTTYGLMADERDHFFLPHNAGLVSKNMLFLNYRPGKFNPGYSPGIGPDGSDGTVNARNFDIGAGFIIKGQWRLGVAFQFNVNDVFSMDETETATATFIADNATQKGENITDVDSAQNNQLRQSYRFNAQFGNKVWAVRNTLWINNYQDKNKPTAAVATGANGALTAAYGGIATGAKAPDYSEVTVAGASTITEDKFKAGRQARAGEAWMDTVTLGGRPANVIEGLKPYNPWYNIGLGFGRSEDVNETGGLYTYRGYERDYETKVVDAFGERITRKGNLTYDNYRSYWTLAPAVTLDWGHQLNPNFRLGPRIVYSGQIRVYGNDAGGGKEKGYVSYTSADLEQFEGYSTAGKEIHRSVNYESSVIDDMKWQQHQFNQHIQLNGTFDTFTFALRYVPGFQLNYSTTENSGYTNTIVKYNEGDAYENYTQTTETNTIGSTIKTRQFQWSNTFYLVGTLWVKPKVFRVSAGTNFTNLTRSVLRTTTTQGTITGETTTSKEYEDGHKDATTGTSTVTGYGTASERQQVSSPGVTHAAGWTGAFNGNATMRVGATWYLNENINFDFFFGTSAADNSTDLMVTLNPLNWGIQLNVKW